VIRHMAAPERIRGATKLNASIDVRRGGVELQ
jgi:hypothetical protein